MTGPADLTMPGAGAADSAKRLADGLSIREAEVLHLVALGWTNREIGQKLGISTRTAEVHRSNMLVKLKARNSADAVRISMTRGILPGMEAGPAGSGHSALPARTLAAGRHGLPVRTLRMSVRRRLAAAEG